MPAYPDASQIRAWQSSTRGYERAAAVIAVWAGGQQKWAMVPSMGELGLDDTPLAAFTQARNTLARLGVLMKDKDDYFVLAGKDEAAASLTTAVCTRYRVIRLVAVLAGKGPAKAPPGIAEATTCPGVRTAQGTSS